MQIRVSCEELSTGDTHHRVLHTEEPHTWDYVESLLNNDSISAVWVSLAADQIFPRDQAVIVKGKGRGKGTVLQGGRRFMFIRISYYRLSEDSVTTALWDTEKRVTRAHLTNLFIDDDVASVWVRRDGPLDDTNTLIALKGNP